MARRASRKSGEAEIVALIRGDTLVISVGQTAERERVPALPAVVLVAVAKGPPRHAPGKQASLGANLGLKVAAAAAASTVSKCTAA